jgi:hypothetical protein
MSPEEPKIEGCHLGEPQQASGLYMIFAYESGFHTILAYDFLKVICQPRHIANV